MTHTNMYQDIIKLPRPTLSQEVRHRLMRPNRYNGREPRVLEPPTKNPSIKEGQYRSSTTTILQEANAALRGNGNGHGGVNGNGGSKGIAGKRYFVAADDGGEWPPDLNEYNNKFADTLKHIKRRHDSVVTTVAQGILEWKRSRQRLQIDSNIQSFLDRFYMSRIGIRMLIGQHFALTNQQHQHHPKYVGII